MRFRDRREAGRLLGERMKAVIAAETEPPLVLGLPRGGVPVAYEVARALDAPLDVLVVRKLGVPWHPELAMGAVGEGGVLVVNDDVVQLAGVNRAAVAEAERREVAEVASRSERFRQGREAAAIEGRTVVIVDDGLATGATARAAVRVARQRGAVRVVLAVPVAAPDTAAELAEEADEVVCLETPSYFGAVGAWYRDFRQTSDEEVSELLADQG